MECIYLIRHNKTGLHKIGMTENWSRRSKELKIGAVTTLVKIIECKDARKWEKVLHVMFKHKRIPQSEWFTIEAEDAIPKMNWIAALTNKNMIIGNWKQAQAGHYYRRRRSKSGNWYTEQKSFGSMKYEQEIILESRINTALTERENIARKEPGYWATKENPNKVEWLPKDPTYKKSKEFLVLSIILFIIALISNQPIFILPALFTLILHFNANK